MFTKIASLKAPKIHEILHRSRSQYKGMGEKALPMFSIIVPQYVIIDL